MKKLIIFFICVIIILLGLSCMYLIYKADYNQTKMENRQYEGYLNKELSVSDLITIINKAIDSNIKNEVPRDNKGKYIENDSNSINIDIKMLDYDKTYNMELFYNSGMSNFKQIYIGIKFKITNIEYHKLTRKSKIYII